jgi:hypothetical protein
MALVRASDVQKDLVNAIAQINTILADFTDRLEALEALELKTPAKKEAKNAA